MADETKNRENEQRKEKDHHSLSIDSMNSGGMENASGNRGGTTDMDDDALTTARTNAKERGSGLSTKNSVTGSDYDGQLAT